MPIGYVHNLGMGRDKRNGESRNPSSVMLTVYMEIKETHLFQAAGWQEDKERGGTER
jgi:hypothetical protein